MRLDELVSGLGIAVPEDASRLHFGLGDLALDSRSVAPGSLFAALPGSRADGTQYINEAVRRGAAAVLAHAGTAWPQDVPSRPLLLHPEPAQALARMAARLAGPLPSRVVAVTGTNGKTSTVDFIRQLWALDGIPAASLGTLGMVAEPEVAAGIGAGLPAGASLTTSDSLALARRLAALRGAGVEAVALEASSHGLAQFRLDGVTLSAAGFSNLTRDHLDYHATMASYRAAKLRLFEAVLPEGSVAAANSDMDPATLEAVMAICRRRGQSLRLVGARGSTIRLLETRPLPDGQVLELQACGDRFRLRLDLPGRFQADNALLAAALAAANEAALPDVLQRLTRLRGVRGRMERCARLADGAAAYVDYAHTPDALARLLESLRPHTLGRLVVVFGAGGDRDAGKRPLMGEVAQRLADLVIVTDDNPRSERPETIRAAIRAGCPQSVEIADREHAIEAGLEAIRAGDVLVVAGKGHEQGQIVGGETRPFDDREVIRRLAGVAA